VRAACARAATYALQIAVHLLDARLGQLRRLELGARVVQLRGRQRQVVLQLGLAALGVLNALARLVELLVRVGLGLLGTRLQAAAAAADKRISGLADRRTSGQADRRTGGQAGGARGEDGAAATAHLLAPLVLDLRAALAQRALELLARRLDAVELLARVVGTLLGVVGLGLCAASWCETRACVRARACWPRARHGSAPS
jgi:hypothetical protein